MDRLDAEALVPGTEEQLHYHPQAVRAGYADYERFATDLEYVDMPHGGLWSEKYLDDRFEQGVDVTEATDPGVDDPWAYQVGEPYRTEGHEEAMPRGPLVNDFDATASAMGASTAEPNSAESDLWNTDEEGPSVTTNHYAVVDGDGNLVMSTTTLGVGWQAGIMPGGTGFMMSVPQLYFGGAGSVNEPRPHKRPGIPMCHVAAFDDEPVLALGTPQGPPAIYSVVPRTRVNVLTHDMDLTEATVQPRVALGWGFPSTDAEPTLDDDIVAGLKARGNAMSEDVLGSMQSIRKHRRGRTGRWEWAAAADPRRDGDAAAVDDDVPPGPPEDTPGQGPPEGVSGQGRD